MKTSELLRRARVTLADTDYRKSGYELYHYINSAASQAGTATSTNRDAFNSIAHARRRATNMINFLLGDAVNLSIWLNRRKPRPLGVNLMWTDEGKQKLKTTRLAWLDHLIAHFESIQD